MYTEWLAMEHYRIHLMEEWPESARKDAGLVAARAALQGLELSAPSGGTFVCDVCASRRAAADRAKCETSARMAA